MQGTYLALLGTTLKETFSPVTPEGKLYVFFKVLAVFFITSAYVSNLAAVYTNANKGAAHLRYSTPARSRHLAPAQPSYCGVAAA